MGCAACGYPNSKIRKYNWCTKASRRTRTGTGRMKNLRRALKRVANRKRFNKLAPILKTAITNAAKETNKRMPPRRAIKKQLRKQKNLIKTRRAQRKKFIDSLQDEVLKRCGVAAAEAQAKKAKKKSGRSNDMCSVAGNVNGTVKL